MASVFGKDYTDRSSLVHLKKEAVDVSKLLVNLQISKINRRANMVAHEIAKFSFDNRSDGFLFHSVLPCVAKFVINDCTNILS